MTKEKVRRTFTLSRFDFLWAILIVMLGINMLWTAGLIQPIQDIFIGQREKVADVIENQNNNTALLVEMFDRQNKLLANQIVLVTKLTNATNTIHQASADINQHVEDIILQTDRIGEMVSYFRENFNETFVLNETVENSRGEQILKNVTRFGEQLVLLREELGELTDLLANRTTTAVSNFILPVAMAQEDIVGDILKSKNISRNPPEEPTGGISGFDEPIVIESQNQSNITG